MLRVRSRISVSHRSDNVLVVQVTPTRRIVFGLLGALLLLAFFVSVDWQEDLSGRLIAGSIFYFSMTAICLGVSAWNNLRTLDRATSRIRIEKRLFGVVLRGETIDRVALESVTVQSIRLLKESEKPRDRMLSRPLRGYMDRRTAYHKLFLDMGEQRLLIEDSSDLAELDTIGQGIADFYDVTYRREEA